MKCFFEPQPDLPWGIAGATFGRRSRYANLELGGASFFFDGVRPAQPLRHLRGSPAGILHVAFQDHDELIREPAACQIASTNLCVQPFSDLLQYLIPGLMAQRLVEECEIVYVEKQHAELLARRDPQFDLPFELAQVYQAGQGVDCGRVLLRCQPLANLFDERRDSSRLNGSDLLDLAQDLEDPFALLRAQFTIALCLFCIRRQRGLERLPRLLDSRLVVIECKPPPDAYKLIVVMRSDRKSVV